MMDRIINVVVNGSHLTKDSRMGGVQHESNSRYLRVAFDPGWDRYAKKITFWNALGQDPVELTFTTDKLEDAVKSYRLYLCPIPGEALREAGEFTFVIDGWADGVRQRSVMGKLLCEPAPYIDKAGQPSDPTPTQAEQLQTQIDALKPQIQAAAQAADVAGEVLEAAKLVQDNVQTSVDAAQSAQEARRAAEQARDEVQDAVSGDFATSAYVDAKSAGAESNANAYTDMKIAAIPTADVSGQIGAHNASTEAHADIRNAVAGAFGQFGSNYRTDLNEFAEIGGFICTSNSTLNRPDGVSQYGLVWNVRGSKTVDYIVQGYYDAAAKKEYVRYRTDNTWGAWKQIATTDAIPVITAGTTDLTAGTSALATGAIYQVYE